MSDQSKKSNRKTSNGSSKSTSSLGSMAGRTLFDWRVGHPEEECGPDQPPVSPSPVPEKEKESTTSGTSGPRCSASSASVALQSFLVSRLEARMDLPGSMEYTLTWIHRTTPSGLSISRLRARGRRTSDNACSGWPFPWPTPMAGSQATEQHNAAGNTDYSRRVEWLSGWGSPTARDYRYPNAESREDRLGLTDDQLNNQVVHLAGWETPIFHDGRRQCGGKGSTNGTSLSRDVVLWLAGWTTPQASEPATVDRPSREETGRTTEFLGRQVLQLSGWDTPTTAEADKLVPNSRDGIRHQLLGATTSSSAVETRRCAESVLNPAMSRWLMGYPAGRKTPGWDTSSPGWDSWVIVQSLLAEWSALRDATGSDACVDTVMPSSQPSPSSSSGS